MLNEEKQKKVILIGWILLIPLAFAIALTLIQRVSAKKGSFTDDTVSGEYFTVDTNGTAKTDEFSLYTGGGMPCEDPEYFKEWLRTYEQATEEETEEQAQDDETLCEVPSSEGTESESDDQQSPVLYSIDGRTLNPDIQIYLYNKLAESGVEWFFPYAVLICYQESHFDVYAENRNGLDKGLFQYRITYYEGSDIFDPYEQIDIFVQQMAHRAEIGCDVYEMISRHNVSDYMPYNHEYVATVLSHERGLKLVGE